MARGDYIVGHKGSQCATSIKFKILLDEEDSNVNISDYYIKKNEKIAGPSFISESV